MAIRQKEQETEAEKVRPGREFRFRKGGGWIGGEGVRAAGAGVERNEAGVAQSKTLATLTGVAESTNETKLNDATTHGKGKGATKASGRGPSLKDGAEKLKQAADKALLEITDEAVSELKVKAKKGDVVCVKTLLSFSERKKPREKPKKRRRGKSLAEQLGNERQWEGPDDAYLDSPFGDGEAE
jgi:hypothetical protein